MSEPLSVICGESPGVALTMEGLRHWALGPKKRPMLQVRRPYRCSAIVQQAHLD
jgi:hypothetical protein